MSNIYYDTIDKLEKSNVSQQYILGWASGYLGNPKLEEQRLTDAYEAGYIDGREKITDNSKDWEIVS